ncbi:GTPase ObgE [Desulfoplanes sp.]
MRFVDEAEILVRSGKGGAGCVSFRREKYIPKGGPDGGDGGKGGDVIFRGREKLLSLYDFRHKRVYGAENGRPGQGRMCYGRAGQDMVVDVPAGTLIYRLEEDGGETLIADLVDEGQEVVLVEGGRGGKGNTHFKSSTMRAPRFAQPGEPAQEIRIRLELKFLADVGLLGLPNAGKSTFISTISAARPKVAPYPFTTLNPNLGVVVGDDGRRLVVADIPGLIQGAHAGQGLGHTFLKHVERSRFLVHILSAEDISMEDPWAGFDLIDEELAQYKTSLRTKKQLLVINKIDLLSEEHLLALKEAARDAGRDVFFIAALYEKGVDALLAAMWRELETMEG